MDLVINTSRQSPNYNDRPKGVVPSAIVLHTTEGSWPSDIDWLCNPQVSGKYERVSCHYVISPSGEIFILVDERKRAWHAGTGDYLGIYDWNNISIGIEVSRRFGDPWKKAQLDALRLLCLDIIARYGIQESMIVAHRWIAPKRRSDPTNWSDEGLRAWIKELYVPDYAELWGDRVYYFVGSGIELAWRPFAHELGQAAGNETGDALGRVWRLFDHGAISYEPVTGETIVYQPRKQV